jgi:FixJ family two-component response regulator
MTAVRKPRIIVIDDDDSVSEPMRLLMELHCWDARTYNSCEAFLDDFDKDEPPACIVLELSFPGMSGVDLQRELSRRGFSIPTIVLTAWPDGALARLAIESGATELITKPVTGHYLISKIESAINSTCAELADRV